MIRPLAALLLTAACAAPAAAQAGLRIEGAGGASELVADRSRGAPAFGAEALQALGGAVTDTPAGARVVLFGDTLEFAAFSPWFRARGALLQLASPVYRSGGRLFWPRELFASWIPGRWPDRVEATAGGLRLRGGAGPADVARPPATPEPAPRLVVLDAGHGGRDPGKVGASGVREKDVTLAVARRVAGLLRSRGGYDVRLTRSTDTLVALADRPRMANAWKQDRPAALFVSIHANSHRNPAARGFETYFLSEARTEDERRVAEMENAAVQYERDGRGAGGDDVTVILAGLRNDFYVRASNDLAEVVQRRVAAFHPGPNRGVKQAGFRVLVGALMPAVLVETAFLSAPEEERLLASAAFQDKVAYGIADAIEQFFVSHDHLWSGGGTR